MEAEEVNPLQNVPMTKPLSIKEPSMKNMMCAKLPDTEEVVEYNVKEWLTVDKFRSW
jgi:hypothetical protein